MNTSRMWCVNFDRNEFGKNFHIRYPSVFEKQRGDLVLVKGGPDSRLLEKAHKISSAGEA